MRRLGAVLAGLTLVATGVSGCGSSKDGKKKDVCELASTAFSFVVERFSHNEDAASIVHALDVSKALPTACEAAINKWGSDASTSVQVIVNGSSGSKTVDATRTELTLPAPAPAPGSASRIIACWGYKLQIMTQLCDDGIIDVPQPTR